MAVCCVTGCPVSCKLLPKYLTHEAKIPCEDAAVGSPQLTSYLDTWKHYSERYSPDRREYAQMLIDLLKKGGCQGLVDMLKVLFPGLMYNVTNPKSMVMELMCGGKFLDGHPFGPMSFPIKNMQILCPVTCGCANSKSSLSQNAACPPSCRS